MKNLSSIVTKPARRTGPCVVTAILCLIVLSVGCRSDARSEPSRSVSLTNPTTAFPLWGHLSPGPYRVGFRSVFRHDTSRTWRETRNSLGTFSPDPNGRPIQVNVWYPASGTITGPTMTVGSYVNQTAPDEFSDLNKLMISRSRENTGNAVPANQMTALLATPVNARMHARLAAGHFPVVLTFAGLNGEINSNFILAEYLASHGYVVASISILGLSEQQPAQARNPSGIEATVRDMEFALMSLGEISNADRTKLAVLGHSVGAVEAVAFALRNGNVQAVIGLDGTYGFKGSAEVLTNTYGYAPEKLRAAILDLRRAQGEQDADLNLAPVLAFRFAGRNLITLPHMHHSDFTSFAMVASKFQVPTQPKYEGTGWNRETGRIGYEAVCNIVREFLARHLIANSNSTKSFAGETQSIEGATFTELSAEYAPVSPPEVITLAGQGGLNAVKSYLTRISGNDPVRLRVNLSDFNTAGYDLLGQHRTQDAVLIFEIAAWAHPTSANAQDSLADAYLAINDASRAKSAIKRAIELAPADPSLEGESKSSFIAEEQRRLEQIQ